MIRDGPIQIISAAVSRIELHVIREIFVSLVGIFILTSTVQ